jgi:hypothetical protein
LPPIPRLIVTQELMVYAMRSLNTTKPVVFGFSSDPVDCKLVQSWAHPGANLRLRSRPCSVGTPTRRPMMAASGWCATAICQSAMRRLHGWAERTRTGKCHFDNLVEISRKFSFDRTGRPWPRFTKRGWAAPSASNRGDVLYFRFYELAALAIENNMASSRPTRNSLAYMRGPVFAAGTTLT